MISFEKWFVRSLMMNMSGGVSNETIMKDTEADATHKYYDVLSKLGGNEQTKYLQVELVNPNGIVVKVDQVDNAKFVAEAIALANATEEVTE